MQEKSIIYFDNAATTFKPYRVINKINEYYKHLKSFSLVQKENDRVLQDLWGYVKTDLMELKKDQQ